MKIRRATPADVAAIAEIHVSTWRIAYRGQVPDAFLDGLSVERRSSAWSDILETTSWPSTGILVAEGDGGDAVGFAHISASRDEDADPQVGELTSLYVAPGAWRQGAGRALLDGAAASMRAAGFTKATLWVLDTNVGARAFYEQLGWEADGAAKMDDRGDFALSEVRYTMTLG